MVIDIGYWNKVIRRIIELAFIILLFYFAIKLSVFYIPFLIAFIIATLIEPIIKWTSKKTLLERKKSAIIVLIIFFSFITGILILGITTLISESSNLLSKINDYINLAYNKFQEISANFKLNLFQNNEDLNLIIQGTSKDILNTISNTLTKFLQELLNIVTSLPEIGIYSAITIIATYFICTDRFYILDQLEHHIPSEWVRKLGIHLREILSSLGNYIKAEVILVGIDFIIILVGLIIMNILNFKIKYPLLMALLIGFVDALPLIGSGTIIVPWAVISALNGNLNLAIGLIILLAIIMVTRQFLEPKVISSKIGIHPIFTLISMYTGYKIIGIMGMLIGPIILIILKSIFGKMLDKGLLKTIFDKR